MYATALLQFKKLSLLIELNLTERAFISVKLSSSLST